MSDLSVRRQTLRRRKVAALVDNVSVQYEEGLVAVASPLAQAEGLYAVRHRYVEDVVLAVVQVFRDVPGRPAIPTHAAARAIIAGGVPPRDFTEANATLFTVALAEITKALGADPVSVSSALFQRLMADGVDAYTFSAGPRGDERAPSEYVDVAVLRNFVRDRKADVLERIVQNTPTSQIAEDLGITGKTVKNYITELGRLFGVQGRAELTQRARELSILIAIPTMVAVNSINDTVANTNFF